MRNRILVTGGGGFVGSHLTRKLLESGRHVRVLDRFLYGRGGLKDLLGHDDLEVMEGDIRDRETLTRALGDVDCVVALAAIVGDAACDLNPERTREVNYQATETLVDACRRTKVRRVVFASSCSVYGANGSEALGEDAHLNPVSLYAHTRVQSEESLHKVAGELEVVILRLATVCGVSPRMRFDLMVNTMTRSAASEGHVRVSGGSQWRPHLHVQDAAEAFLQASVAPVRSGSVFNVGSDEQNFTVGEVAEKVLQHMPGALFEDLGNNGDQRSYKVSFARIRDELGFQPRLTVDDAIDEVRTLIEQDAVGDPADARFHNARWLRAASWGDGAE